jgi:hypothetical protein
VRQIGRVVKFATLALVLLYGGDYFSARYRIPGNRETLGSVQVQTLWAIKQKDGRIDYESGDTNAQTCIYSLFPQLGYTPCWYLTKHANKIIQVGRAAPRSRYPDATLTFCAIFENRSNLFLASTVSHPPRIR